MIRLQHIRLRNLLAARSLAKASYSTLSTLKVSGWLRHCVSAPVSEIRYFMRSLGSEGGPRARVSRFHATRNEAIGIKADGLAHYRAVAHEQHIDFYIYVRLVWAWI
jgi:hypothetical protein